MTDGRIQFLTDSTHGTAPLIAGMNDYLPDLGDQFAPEVESLVVAAGAAASGRAFRERAA